MNIVVVTCLIAAIVVCYMAGYCRGRKHRDITSPYPDQVFVEKFIRYLMYCVIAVAEYANRGHHKPMEDLVSILLQIKRHQICCLEATPRLMELYHNLTGLDKKGIAV